MSLWPVYKIASDDSTSIIEDWRETDNEVNHQPIARCENPNAALRVRDGLELMAIAEPETWWDDDSLQLWKQRPVELMHKLLARFLPTVESAADAYIRATGGEGDWFEGITEINDDSIRVKYSVRGCGSGCCPDYYVGHNIPLQFIWDRDGVIAELNETKRLQELEKKLKAEEEFKKKAEEARIAQEKRDQAEFERLKAKYEGGK
jgi:hypothetical protein